MRPLPGPRGPAAPDGSLELKAASLLHSIAGHHALVDGNKRLARLATVVFVDVNGCRPALSDQQAFELVMDVAGGDLPLAEITTRLSVAPP